MTFPRHPQTIRSGALRLAHGAEIEWLQFGRGALRTVVIPGAGDGLWTVRQWLPLFAWRYRRRYRTHRLLIMGRREPIPERFGIAAHAEDYLDAVERLAWGPAVWECISAGGPIGQCAAIRRPDMVRGLVLASTMHRSDAVLRSVLQAWRELTEQRRWGELYWSIAALNRQPETVRRLRWLRPLLRLTPIRANAQRFVRLLDELLHFDNSAVLAEIACPTLVIGGEADRIVSADLQREMAALIPNSRLVLYPCYGHAAPLEHPSAERTIMQFVQELGR
ncbi:MAG: alpha/beta fold hydrolase [Chloroflexota bacterium]